MPVSVTPERRLAVIFDCDGVLLDSMGAWHSVDDKLAEEAGKVVTKADRDHLTVSSIPECGRYMHEEMGIGQSTDDVLRMLDDKMHAFYRDEVEAKKGALEFVRGLHELGIPMAVASSTPPKLLLCGLRRAGLDGYMQAIVSVDDVGASKEHPDVYDKARESLGTDRGDTWVFEDSLYAIDTLNRAGYNSFALYDSDIAGKHEELIGSAKQFRESLGELPASDFIEIVK